jgi:predicted dehydrogenase
VPKLAESFSPFSVLIVGCGNIAGGFDQERSIEELPYTHAGAYKRDGRFNIKACVDPDDGRRTEFMNTWGIPLGFRSIEEVWGSSSCFDVISICSPTMCHAHDLESVLCLNPKLIFCEKPITEFSTQAERLVAKCRDAHIHLAVNYMRRWDPSILKLRVDVLAGKWGQLRSVIGLYNKGILNNGSHMLDLLHFLVGPCEIFKVGKPTVDFFSNDPTIPVWLEGLNGLPIYLACGHAEDYAIFELQMVFSQGVLTIEDGGFYWRERRVTNSEIFKGYRMLEGGIRKAGGNALAMREAVDNIYRTITQGDVLSSTGESALVVQRVCERIKRLALEI